MGRFFLLQWIFLTQELNQVSCIAGGFFTSWATREAHLGCHRAPNLSSLHHKASFHCMLGSFRWAFSPLTLSLESFCVRSCLILLSNKTFSLSGLTMATCVFVCVCVCVESYEMQGQLQLLQIIKRKAAEAGKTWLLKHTVRVLMLQAVCKLESKNFQVNHIKNAAGQILLES